MNKTIEATIFFKDCNAITRMMNDGLGGEKLHREFYKHLQDCTTGN